MVRRAWWQHPAAGPRRAWRRAAGRAARGGALLALLVGLGGALLAAPLAGRRAAALAAPPAETWTTLAPMPHQQQEAAVAVLDGRIYVMGGFSDDPQPFTLVQVYDPATDQWHDGTPLPEPVHHAGAATIDGKIYLVGGFRNPFGQREPVDAVWAYDPATDRWTARAPLPTPRGALGVAAIGDRLYAVGGEHRRPPDAPRPTGSPLAYEPLADLTVYDPAADRWDTLTPMRVRRDHLAIGSIGGRLYVASGRDRPVYDLPFLEEYDPASDTWTTRARMPTGRSGGYGAVLNGQLYVFGGEGNPASPLGVYDQVEGYNPATDAWTEFGPMPTPRHSLVAAAVGNRIYLAGGSTQQGTLGAATTQILDAFDPGQ
ncbi:MAG TPA: kelch repeat-containing protein [Chloroflexota bacterium]|nr:kelch repeat-containing protein [Chloroflexota bacterium]